ncbi:hypothetical protein DLAC_07004 [Tieghemostelium lacteum]|uniref:B box-type domain-containing protein n=1 Tax=Tieghemostelium lacteum TaxID=361077 RepID=A0A151ZDX3_TIELA|nr:hypothetical protein DLAC_07004 [Tieghemostelium lacteum]|eukprot:KYQ92162.1 hypothetical protein DLAC_07004 [Tieghemostelium lacteum]
MEQMNKFFKSSIFGGKDSDMIVCTDSAHLKTDNLYCLDCEVSCCRKCKKTLHPIHNVEPIDKLYKDVKLKFADIQEHLIQFEKDKKRQKDNCEKLFKHEIQEQYDKQMLLLTSHFRAAHDLLHIKEVDLKRELKSHYEETLEAHTIHVSQLEMDIEKSITYSQQYKDILDRSMKTHDNQSNVTLIESPTEKSLKIDTFKICNQMNKIISESEQPDIIYRQPVVNWEKMNNIQSLLETQLQLIHPKKYIFRTPRDASNGQCFERIDIDSGNCDILLGKSNRLQIALPEKIGKGFYPSFIGDERVFYFFKDKYYTIGLDLFKKSEWTSGQTQLSPHVLDYSTLYDSQRERIYIAGGIHSITHVDQTDIYMFDLKTYNSILIGKLLTPNTLLSLSMGKDCFYIIGGFENNRNINRIDRFNLDTGKCEIVKDFGSQNNVLNGIFVQSSQCFYIIEDTKPLGFIKYILKDNHISRLSPPPAINPQNGTLISLFKLFYDQCNTIYFIYPLPPYQNSIFKYNIERDQWITIEMNKPYLVNTL